ncbi:hypothetical protein FSHL1_012753 [Fusarium sambucinum]
MSKKPELYEFERSLRASISRYGEENSQRYCNRMHPRSGPESVGPHIDYRGLISYPKMCGVMTDDEIAHTMSTDPSWQSKARGCRMHISVIEQETHDDDDDDDAVEDEDQPTWQDRTVEVKDRSRVDLTSVDPCICLDDNGVGIAFLLSLGLLLKTCPDGRVVQAVVEENAQRTFVQIPPSWDQSNFIMLAKVFSLLALALERLDYLDIHPDMEKVLEAARSKIQDELLMTIAARANDDDLEVSAPVLPFLPLDRLCGHGKSLTLGHFQRIVLRTVPYYAVAPRDKVHRASCGCLFPGGLAEIGKDLAVPETKVIPRRFYDAHRSNESHLKDKIVTTTVDTSMDNYVALSYPWNSYDSDDLERIIATVDKVLDHRYYWVDRWCIGQDSYEDKEREVPKMKDYYSNAGCTLILPGVALPTELAQLKTDGVKVQLFMPELAQKVKEIWKGCQWTRRCWTLQEAYMSKECIFWTGQENAPLIHCSQLLGILHSSPFDSHYINALPYLPVDIGQFGETTLVGRSLAIAESTAESIYQRSIVRCAGHGTVLEANAYQRPLAVLVDKIRGREATLELDEYYSLFSMASDKLPAVDYKINTAQLIERMISTGALGANILLTNTGQGSGGKGSWVPRRCIQREYSMMGMEVNALQPTLSDGAMIISAYPLTMTTESKDRDYFAAGSQMTMMYFQHFPATEWSEKHTTDVVISGVISRKLNKASNYLLLQPPNWGHGKYTSGLVLLATEKQQPGEHCVVDATLLDNMAQDRYLENRHMYDGKSFHLI